MSMNMVLSNPCQLTRSRSRIHWTTFGVLSCLLWLGSASPSAQPPPAATIVLHAADAPVVQGAWQIVPNDASAASGRRVWHPNAGVQFDAQANPTHYFQLTFHARANTPYHLWIRGRAENDSDTNESVWVQFSDSVTSAGAPTFRIGTTDKTEVNLEDCLDCNVQGWGWQDNGWIATGGQMGQDIYFASTGMHTIRVQTRQDGFSIDQIVLSPNTYLTSSPGVPQNDTVKLTRTAREVIIWADDVTTGNTHGAWSKVTDAGAAGQVALHHPDASGATVTTPFVAPVDYFDVAFTAEANVPYHLWIRGRAQNDSDANESVWVQFSDSVDSAQNATYRIGTVNATEVNLEDCSVCNVHGWGWQDNGWISSGGQMGPNIYFPTTGPRTLRVQTRQDGFFIDQIVLSPVAYVSSNPGLTQDDGLVLASTVNARPFVQLSANTQSGNAPLNVTFDAIAYDPDGASVSYLWTFRPGQTSTAPPPRSHSYPAGEYTATLRVTDAGAKFTEASLPISSQTTSATVRFKFMAWNVQHGTVDDESQTSLEEVAQYIKAQAVSVVALNEASGSNYTNPNFITQLRNRLQEIMLGRTWNYRFMSTDSNALLWLAPSDDGTGTLGFTTVTATDPVYTFTNWRNYPRSAGSVTLSIANRNVTFISTHFECGCGESDDSEPVREAEATEFRTWDDNVGPIRIVGGDFNVDTPSNLNDPSVEQTIPRLRTDYNDVWVSAPAGTATTDHPSGDSRTVTWSGSRRVDYIFLLKNIPNLNIVSMKHGYPKNASGHVLSDHFPLIATFDIW